MSAAPDAAALARVLRGESGHRLVLQPIVDVARGVVTGYEALSRFDDLPGTTPDRWFAAAEQHGVGAELEARVLSLAVGLRPRLAAGRFLSVNITPRLLGTVPLLDVLHDVGDLRGMVLELTEHVPFGDLEQLKALLAPWRAAGAGIALDDTGNGYAGLQQIATLRPDVVKLDRALVSCIDRDPARLALAELLGTFADRVDAWLLAEGVERREELDVLAGLGVPLAQGFLLGRPAPEPVELRVELAAHLLGYALNRAGADRVLSLIETVPVVREVAAAVAAVVGGGIAIVTGRQDEPERLVLADPEGEAVVRDVSLVVLPGETLAAVAVRAVTRPQPVRLDPVVCIDDRGLPLGIVRIERLVLALSDQVRSQPQEQL